jgi:hypothetical protein
MTRALVRANWIGPPSPIHLWMEALLRAFAMLVSNLADIVRLRPSRPLSDWHTDVSRRSRKAKAGAAPAPLPQQDRDPATKETETAAPSSNSHKARMVSSTRSVRPSNCEERSRRDGSIQWIDPSDERPKRQRRAGGLPAATFIGVVVFSRLTRAKNEAQRSEAPASGAAAASTAASRSSAAPSSARDRHGARTPPPGAACRADR